ncbi:GLPGLI family protein [Chryseobacterium sp.]|uniref:GLPGLI family protein n=1 Tax=Chryseobacterium sp. TaxID=1871047 RepID=UPI002898D8F4|nr:GLPGLI family protein [Chryseobacterium sp.]
MAVKNNVSPSTIRLPDGIYQNKTSKNKDFIYTIEYIGIQPFKIKEKTNFKWKLSKETKQIEGYHCQKATLNYSDRTWEAWFTKEIPIQQGPYVFSGLPGMIVQIADTENHHIFTLKANYKIPQGSTGIYTRPYFVPVEIDTIAFNKKWNDFRKNPLGGTEQFMQMNPGLLSGESYDENGNKSLIIERKKQERAYSKKQLENYNNHINIELYKKL